jgi:hypothetical protein
MTRMLIEVVIRAAHILRRQPGYSMPLTRLHAQLVHELGPQAGSYAEIYQQLRRRTDSFAFFNAPRALSSGDTWRGIVRDGSAAALDSAGMGSVVRVALTEALPREEASDLAAALNTTMSELAALCAQDTTLAAYIERATIEVTELSRVLTAVETDRPTTLPPDPPRAG